MKKFVAGIFFVLAQSAFAIYNMNMSGELETLHVYSESDQIYFRLKNQPTAHPACNPAYFVIPSSVTSDRRKAMLTRLSLAFAMKEPINIGYDAQGSCADGYIQVHRVG